MAAGHVYCNGRIRSRGACIIELLIDCESFGNTATSYSFNLHSQRLPTSICMQSGQNLIWHDEMCFCVWGYAISVCFSKSDTWDVETMQFFSIAKYIIFKKRNYPRIENLLLLLDNLKHYDMTRAIVIIILTTVNIHRIKHRIYMYLIRCQCIQDNQM